MGRKQNTPEDVWKYIQKRGPNECWPWIGTIKPGRYGVFSMGFASYRAHRVVFFVTHPGKIELNVRQFSSTSELVMHSCDNPACCNPRHLKLGNPAKNTDDMVRKGRRHDFNGENGQRAKLTNIQAAKVRELALRKVAQKEIAMAFGISVPAVSMIKHGKTYRSINAGSAK